MFRQGPSFSTVVAMLALVLALCGGAYAVGLKKNSVGTKQLKKNAVVTKKIKDAAVTSAKLTDGAVTAAKVADGAITTAKVADGAITAGKLAPGAIPANDSYTKAESDAKYLSADATTVLQASPLDWQSTNAATAAQIAYDVAGISFNSGVPTNASITIAPTLPATLGGRPQNVVAVNACYNTINATTVTQVQLNSIQNTNGSPSSSALLVDTTDRTDAACRDYVPSTPIPIDATHDVNLEMAISFAGGGGNSFAAGRATFTLQPAD